IIDALAEQIEAETAAFAAKPAGQRFNQTTAPSNGSVECFVLDESIHRCLQHGTNTLEDDRRCVKLNAPGHPRRLIQDAQIVIVEATAQRAARRPRTPAEKRLRQRSQARWQDRKTLQDKSACEIVRFAETCSAQ